MDFTKTIFIKSAVREEDFLRDGKPQVIFAGRSNVGKSSVINSLVRRKNFARVGAQPGKTSQINYFLIDSKFYLVDLPGYGYAKVSKAERSRWARLMESYFSNTDIITLGIMIVDARHKPTQDDITMSMWFKNTGCPLIVVANKTDKVKKSLLKENLMLIQKTLDFEDNTSLVPYSAETNVGRELLISAIEKGIFL